MSFQQGDGDTLRVNQNGQTVTVRLACIDSPESDQPGGSAASERLRQLLPRGQAIQLIPVDTDRYGRTVGVAFANSRSINLQMVREGHAVVYHQYLSNCPNSSNDLLAAEAEARAARRGFWAQPNPVMPWDWRQGTRPSPQSSTPPRPASSPTAPRPTASVTPSPRATRNCEPSYPTVCIPPAPPDLDCGDIPHRRFTVRQPDPHRFDGNRDGIGCER
ncbi:thermonuclease family protein [Leptolyngbya sp. AN02str]|uniref:thermonuclease family protein n=1 Tax=Leptolyngbya sp. AN02str TaxID=3423363 RepID=UPI003D3177CD